MRTAFRIFPYFILVIVLAIPTVTGIAAYAMALAFRDEFFDEAKDYATDVALNLHHRVETEFLAPLVKSGEPVDLLERPDQLAKIQEIVESATFRHRVQKIYFFNTDGAITFSTVTEHIGQMMPPGNVLFETALTGKVASDVRRRHTPLDISETSGNKELLETYVPVHSSLGDDPKRVAGVVEVYQDMTELHAAVRRSRTRIAVVALLSMGILGGLFAIIARKADYVINQRGREILDSNSALQKLSQGLELQVEERTRQLIQQEKLASLGTLAAGVAHEINNPLATISACAEGSLERLKGDAPESKELEIVRRYLGLVRDEVYRCKRITGNLLDFARQKEQHSFEPIDLDAIVRQTVELVSLGTEARAVEFRLELSTSADDVLAEPGEIRQVIHNLISNALAALEGRPDPKIMLRSTTGPRRVILDCIDNGPGIPAALREKVLEPFFTTKAAGQGTGLGLAVCYGILERHGGSLEVIDPSRPPSPGVPYGFAGAWFRLSLPRRLEREPALRAVDSIRPSS